MPGLTTSSMAAPVQSAPLAAASPRERWTWHLAIFLGYLALGLLFTWPLATQLGASVIQKGGLPVDAGQGVWNLWWARAALLRGANPFPTEHLFYPLELNLFFQTLSLPNALLVAPILLAIGPVAAFNSVALLSFGLGGYWAYRLARGLVEWRPAALLAGFVFAFTPYHLQRLWSGPMELIAVQWLALYVLLLLGALARRTLPSVLAATGALLVATLASQYYGLYAAVYSAIHVALAAALAPRGAKLGTLAAGIGVGLLAIGLLLPFVLGAGGLGGVALEDWYERQVYHSLALVDLVVPNIRHPLWGAAAAAWHNELHPFGLEAGAGLGLGVALLCGLALGLRWRRAWPWAALALLMLLLAMGPQLRLTASPSPVPGPFLLLDLAGPFRNSSRPSVFLALVLVPVAVLVALGLEALHTKAQGAPRKAQAKSFGYLKALLPPPASGLLLPASGLLPAALAALVVFESLVAPWPLTPLQAAPGSLLLNADPVPGAVLELPPRNNDSQGLLNQICHGRPLIGGYLARLPDYPLASFPSALQQLWQASEPTPDILALDPAAELASLGVRFVALDLTQLPRFHVGRLRAQLSAPGVSRFGADERREVYAIDPMAARPNAVLGTGWGELEQDGARRWRWMQAQGELMLLARAEAPVLLTLRATAYGAARPLQIWQGELLLGSFEIPGAPAARSIGLRLLVPPGQTALRLESPATQAPDGRQLSLSVEQIAIQALPAAASWQTNATLAIPPTIPATSAPPCQQN